MALTEVLSDLIELRISTDLENGTNYMVVDCETDSEATFAASVSEIVTKRCGTLRAPQTPTLNITLNGVINGTPDANQISYQGLAQLVANQTKVWLEYINESNGTIDEGEGVYMQGQGYISDLGVQTTAGESARFSLGIAFSGNITTVFGS